jgi:hypothetical protein
MEPSILHILKTRRHIMKFSDIFVPRWQNSNPEVRKRALERIKDIKLLEKIAEIDDDPGVCEAASLRLDSLQVKETVS